MADLYRFERTGRVKYLPNSHRLGTLIIHQSLESMTLTRSDNPQTLIIEPRRIALSVASRRDRAPSSERYYDAARNGSHSHHYLSACGAWRDVGRRRAAAGGRRLELETCRANNNRKSRYLRTSAPCQTRRTATPSLRNIIALLRIF